MFFFNRHLQLEMSASLPKKGSTLAQSLIKFLLLVEHALRVAFAIQPDGLANVVACDGDRRH